jgi:alpha-beta hydrolase superfamily lysophospholipase
MIKTKDGLDIHVVDWATPAQPPKACVVLTHGFGEHIGRYAHVAAAFNTAGYALYGYDLRGHGKSGGRRGHTPSMEHLIDDLGRVITHAKQANSRAPLFLYGHSMGGNLTLNYARLRPDGVAGVIANAPWIELAVKGSPVQIALGRLMARIAPGFSQQTPGLKGILSRDPAIDAANEHDALIHRTMSARLFVDVSAAAQALLAGAPGMQRPLLLTHGTDDQVIALSGSERFFDNYGGTDKTFKRYDGGYHELHNDLGARDYVADVLTWLDGHCGRGASGGR